MVHRKLTLSDSAVQQAKSIDGEMNNIDRRSQVGVVREEEEEDRRASTGEISLPAVLTSVSPVPQINEGMILNLGILHTSVMEPA